MRQLLTAAFKDTVDQIKADMAMMPLTRWNESVFRFIFSRAVTKRDPEITQFFECNRIDLVLHRKSERAFVEFKFYIHSPRCDLLSGAERGMKGGAGNKNFGEFKKCVRALKRRPNAHGVLKLVALFYSDPATRAKYDAYYGDSSVVERQLRIRRLVSITPFPLDDSGSICNARLYEVGP